MSSIFTLWLALTNQATSERKSSMIDVACYWNIAYITTGFCQTIFIQWITHLLLLNFHLYDQDTTNVNELTHSHKFKKRRECYFDLSQNCKVITHYISTLGSLYVCRNNIILYKTNLFDSLLISERNIVINFCFKKYLKLRLQKLKKKHENRNYEP